ncbi:PP2C family protein-serine/threonine phosphatase [Roseovarius albus]|uniref:PP2C family protein-serine/threonine phosphatase n=1 Tax=Roseovarius albus TaxID=1247867 RepID=UPI001F2E06DE|nr:SpoIIE family protein phosphatase [Roseovarius albus]
MPERTAIRRVLVVDDSRLQRRILAASLKKFGYDISEAGTGAEALELCKAMSPDLIISDWIMPGMNGLEFCREFRRLPREAYGYFILLTSKSDKSDIASGLDAGADDFLTKPVNSDELRARIAAGDRILRMERELNEKNRLIQSTLEELQSVYDALDKDLQEARHLQQSLVSERYRDLGPAEVSLILRSSGHVGGDLVGTYPINGQRIGLYGIDVSGHGISSALMTARLAGYLSPSHEQNIAMRKTDTGLFVPRPPSETISDLNQLILNELETEHYFTLLLADVDLSSGHVVFAQAGHPCPALQKANGQVEMKGSGGLPVGLIDGANYEDTEFTMSAGDRLMIHSDGVTECADPEGRILDDGGLSKILRSLHQTKGVSCLESLIWRMSEYAGDQKFSDDVSAILLEFKTG